MYKVDNRPKVDDIFQKLAKKNPKQLDTITKSFSKFYKIRIDSNH